jgi:diguanylate cyclase (GGDEF)-like protein
MSNLVSTVLMESLGQPEDGWLLVVQAEDSPWPSVADRLEKLGYKTVRCNNALEAFCQFYKHLPAMVIAEYSLPILNGFQLCRCFKNDPVARYVPVVLLGDPQSHVERYWSYKVGLDAYLDGNLDEKTLAFEVKSVLTIYKKLRQQMGKRALQIPPTEGRLPLNILGETLQEPSTENSQERLLQLLDKALLETTIMREFRELGMLAGQPDLLNHLVFSLLESVMDYQVAALFYNQTDRENFKLFFHLSAGAQYTQESLEAVKNHFCLQLSKHWQFQNLNFEEMEWETIEGTHPSLLSDAPALNVETTAFDMQSAYFDRFEEGEQLYGAFALYSGQEMDYRHIFPIPLLSQELHALMKLQSLYRSRDFTAQMDGISQTYNFSYFKTQLDKECNRAKRYELDFCLALIDIDHYEAFNQEYGIQAGDDLLKSLASQCHVIFRKSDIVARSLEASLAVVFPSSTLEQAQLACNRLREAIKTTPLILGSKKLTCTVSIGLTPFHHQQETAATALYTQALHALKQAKLEGRNRTCLAGV